MGFYGFYAVDDGAAGADAGKGAVAVEVVGDGLEGGFAFGGFDGVEVRGGHGGGRGEDSWISVVDLVYRRVKT